MTAEGLLLRETGKAGPWVDYIKWQLDIAALKKDNKQIFPAQQPPPSPAPAPQPAAAAVPPTQGGIAAGAAAGASDPNVTTIAAGPAGSATPVDNSWSYASYVNYVKGFMTAGPDPNKLNLPPVTEESYDIVRVQQLVGVMIVVYCHKKHSKAISEVQAQIVTTGILGIMGNKGGCGIRFKLHDSTFCIINAHFNAHQTNVQRRNQDYRDICTMLFNIDGTDYTIFDHDNLFWIGDLNYRIDLEDSVCRAKIQQKDWAALLAADQLCNEIKKGSVFTEWEEAPLAFAPTYKYDPNSTEYDTSDKKRVPAWCDRILWKSTPTIKSLFYNRFEYLMSDHRPVAAICQVGVKSVMQQARQVVLGELIKEWDRLENDSIPDAAVSKTDLDFAEVRFGVPVVRSITLENVGRVPCRYRFIPKLNETKAHKEWLQIHPAIGILTPGEKVQINLTVQINESTAYPFNLGKEKIEDIVILHLENGKDYFISISGRYLRSAFGSRLEYLVRFPQPIRMSDPVPPKDQASHLRIPKELWRVVDYLFRNCTEEEDLFLETGDSNEMAQLREALDTGVEFAAKIYPHSMAETLLRFLESLEMPVIPYQLYNQLLAAAAAQSPTQAKAVIARLPEVYYNTFFYIVAFLREMLQLSPKNKLTPEKLAFVFSSVLIRPPPGTRTNDAILKKQAAFIQHFLSVNDLHLSLPPPKSMGSESTQPAGK
jgi:inositol polyphosphate 5-phosphatase INPP5B/F